MIAYPFFCPWKTRRSVLRAVLLAGAFLGVLYALEQGLGSAWPERLDRGDWFRCAAAGLLALPTALLEYGPNNHENRAPVHRLLGVFLLALVALLVITVAPSFVAFTKTLRTSTPEAALESVLPVLWPSGLCVVPAAVVFTAVSRERWRGSPLGFQLKVAALVAVLTSVPGLVIALAGATQIAPFTILLGAPLLFALGLPLLAFAIDWTDDRVFPRHDPTTEAPAVDTTVIRKEVKKVKVEESGERVFSWSAGAEEEEEEPDEQPLSADDDSSGLDGLAARIFEE